ncbi:MAG: iron-containing alcohol dehydrogenase [Desulfobacter sp.]|nr:MAG: iron-containing alcohol dehydrogenase [Desulfobacter sp.]
MMSDIMNVRRFVSPELIFGARARTLAGRYAQQFMASKVLIVTDKGIIDAGWLADVTLSLDQAGIPYHVFSDVSPNPRADEVMAGAEIYTREACDVIISIGGGSPMDCAKGIGMVCSNHMHILEFEGVDKIIVPVPPMIFIPTTAGTSADLSQFCIITNRDERVKIAIVSKAIVPDIALIDPETTTTMDAYLTACTGMDALVHAVEAFVSTGSGPLTDSHALEAIKIVSRDLPALLKEQGNPALRENIMLASMKAGLAFSNASLGAVHAMAHSLGGFLDLPHGECNAMLLDHVINLNYDSAQEKFKAVAQAMGIDTRGTTGRMVKERLVSRIQRLKNEVGITNQLAKRGVKSADTGELARKALKDACMLTNPYKAGRRDIEVVYEDAM